MINQEGRERLNKLFGNESLLVLKENTQEQWREFTEFLVNERVFGHEDRDYLVVEKPVIPQFVANYIEKSKESGYSFLLAYEVISGLNKRGEADKKLVDYIQKNQDDFVRTWYGYTVEEEPKYYAKTKLANMQNWGNAGEDYFDRLHDNSSSKVWLSTKSGALPRTKDEWANLGITEDNADFELVKELEE